MPHIIYEKKKKEERERGEYDYTSAVGRAAGSFVKHLRRKSSNSWKG
jgi:hypothetical protein